MNLMSELIVPEGWKLKTIEDICETITSGGTPSRSDSSYFNGDIPWVKMTDLKNDLILDTKERLTKKGIKNSSAKIFPKNTVLIAMYTFDMGKTAILGVDAATNQAICGLQCKNDVLPKFLLYFIKSHQNQIKKLGSGGAQPNINQSKVKSLCIPMPPLETQKKIVQKLDHIFGQLEEKKKEIISRIEKFDAKKINQNHKNHLLKLAFDGTLTNEKPGEIIDGIQVPKGWELKKISDIIEILYGKGLPKDKRNNGGKFPVYGSNGVVGTHTEYLIDYPSIIIGRKGSAGAINLTSTKFWPTDVTYYVKIKNSKIPLKFVYYLLNDLNLHKLIQSGPKPGLNRNDVYELDFLFPVSNETQKKIVEILDKKFVEWETHKQELENIQNGHDSIKKHLSNLSLSILNDAFSGKLVN